MSPNIVVSEDTVCKVRYRDFDHHNLWDYDTGENTSSGLQEPENRRKTEDMSDGLRPQVVQ
jgi:hypothetical protein